MKPIFSVTRRWKLVFSGVIRGITSDLFQIAWLNECIQRGRWVNKSGFMVRIIRLGLEEYLKMVKINVQIEMARAKKDQMLS